MQVHAHESPRLRERGWHERCTYWGTLKRHLARVPDSASRLRSVADLGVLRDEDATAFFILEWGSSWLKRKEALDGKASSSLIVRVVRRIRM